MSGKDVLILVAIIGGWIALTRWVLPAMGVPTCCSGACSLDWEQQQQPRGEQSGGYSGGASANSLGAEQPERVPPCPYCDSDSRSPRQTVPAEDGVQPGAE